ncbi:hypothetical protein GN958_ATG23314 [Phytophthora infestans]|uniref:Uncharacterized protein n=1 Tax=Phytophthora infestans TaxID=4787 RepID=A0A8S9TLC3_PHYIN|nr:hypothetical protein GN958_ATG23314 [Phytophthora infestans]
MNKTFHEIIVCVKSRDEPLYDHLFDKLGNKSVLFFEDGAVPPTTIYSIKDEERNKLKRIDKYQRFIIFDDLILETFKRNIWFSWPNITAVKANNAFSIIHPTSSGTITLNLTIPDGGYNVSDLNNYLFWYLVSQGYYISNNSTGEQTVYCKFVVNPSTYQVQFISYPVPTALPSGFTAGPQLTFPSTSKGPQLSIASPAFGKVIGFATGTFPSSQPSTITTSLSTAAAIHTLQTQR